ncbi:hypothetical protein SLA2020_041720 [Shorea laevis]
MISVQRHIQNIIIETDCKVAFLLIAGEPNLHHLHSNLLRDCRGLLNMIPQAQLKHVMRESNMAANVVAKIGAQSLLDFAILDECPLEVDLLCLVDQVGVCYPRL